MEALLFTDFLCGAGEGRSASRATASLPVIALGLGGGGPEDPRGAKTDQAGQATPEAPPRTRKAGPRQATIASIHMHVNKVTRDQVQRNPVRRHSPAPSTIWIFLISG